MFSAIIGTILSFVIQAFALKIALSTVGTSKSDNTFGTALTVAFGLNAAFIVLGLLPLMGSLVYLGLWVAVIMTVYRLGFFKSLGVGLMQFVVRGVLGFVFWVLGLFMSFGNALVMSPF